MKVHKDCSTLPIFAFHNVTKTKDLRWLIKDYDNELSLELSDNELIELAEIFSNIFYEYGELTVNMGIVSNYKKQINIKYLESKYNICKKIIDLYLETEDESVLELLNEFKFNINLEQDIASQIEVVVDKLNGLEMEIKIFKINYAKQYDKEIDDSNIDLDKQALLLEMNLNLGYHINTKIISVRRWVNMINVSNEKMKQNGKT